MDLSELRTNRYRWRVDFALDLVAGISKEVVHRSKANHLINN